MFKLKDGEVFACDCDDTLLLWKIPKDYSGPLVTTNLDGFEDKGIANTPAIDHLKKMKSRGFSVVVWSAAGSNWAEAVVKVLNLENYVDICMSKISFHLDDVSDPVDKIGKWQYINIHGIAFSMDKDGNIQERKNTILFEPPNVDFIKGKFHDKRK
jgi:hypothetical protein